MPRMRTLKFSFFENEELAEVDPYGRLLFAGLWCIADREGRLEDRPKRIKAQVFGYEPHVDVESLLQTLSDRGFLRRYVVDGTAYIEISNFKRHQSPHLKEPASDLPGPTPVPAPDIPRINPVPAPDTTGESTGHAPDMHQDNRPSAQSEPSTRPAPDKHGASTVQAPDKHGADTKPAPVEPSGFMGSGFMGSGFMGSGFMDSETNVSGGLSPPSDSQIEPNWETEAEKVADKHQPSMDLLVGFCRATWPEQRLGKQWSGQIAAIKRDFGTVAVMSALLQVRDIGASGHPINLARGIAKKIAGVQAEPPNGRLRSLNRAPKGYEINPLTGRPLEDRELHLRGWVDHRGVRHDYQDKPTDELRADYERWKEQRKAMVS